MDPSSKILGLIKSGRPPTNTECSEAIDCFVAILKDYLRHVTSSTLGDTMVVFKAGFSHRPHPLRSHFSELIVGGSLEQSLNTKGFFFKLGKASDNVFSVNVKYYTELFCGIDRDGSWFAYEVRYERGDDLLIRAIDIIPMGSRFDPGLIIEGASFRKFNVKFEEVFENLYSISNKIVRQGYEYYDRVKELEKASNQNVFLIRYLLEIRKN